MAPPRHLQTPQNRDLDIVLPHSLTPMFGIEVLVWIHLDSRNSEQNSAWTLGFCLVSHRNHAVAPVLHVFHPVPVNQSMFSWNSAQFCHAAYKPWRLCDPSFITKDSRNSSQDSSLQFLALLLTCCMFLSSHLTSFCLKLVILHVAMKKILPISLGCCEA